MDRMTVLIGFLMILGCAPKVMVLPQECIKFNREGVENVYLLVDRMPEYPGGESALIGDVIKLMEFSDAESIQLSFAIEFFVNPDGSLDEVRIKDKELGMYTYSEKTITNIFSEMKNWQAGSCKGTPVIVFQQLTPKTARAGL